MFIRGHENLAQLSAWMFGAKHGEHLHKKRDGAMGARRQKAGDFPSPLHGGTVYRRASATPKGDARL
jgi:hypothetical protein